MATRVLARVESHTRTVKGIEESLQRLDWPVLAVQRNHRDHLIDRIPERGRINERRVHRVQDLLECFARAFRSELTQHVVECRHVDGVVTSEIVGEILISGRRDERILVADGDHGEAFVFGHGQLACLGDHAEAQEVLNVARDDQNAQDEANCHGYQPEKETPIRVGS